MLYSRNGRAKVERIQFVWSQNNIMCAHSSDSQKENFSVRSDVELPLPFIPDELDEYRLSAAEFRIYGHVVRMVGENGSCVESVTDMARTCRISEKVIVKALNKLTDVHKLLIRNRRVGEIDEYTLTDMSEWKQPVPLEDRLRDTVERRRKSTKVTKLGDSKPKGFG